MTHTETRSPVFHVRVLHARYGVLIVRHIKPDRPHEYWGTFWVDKANRLIYLRDSQAFDSALTSLAHAMVWAFEDSGLDLNHRDVSHRGSAIAAAMVDFFQQMIRAQRRTRLRRAFGESCSGSRALLRALRDREQLEAKVVELETKRGDA